MTCEQAGFNEPWPVPFGTDRRKAQHEGLTFIANLDSSQHAFLQVARYVPQSILQNLWIRGICLFQGCKRQMPRQQGSTQKVETLGPILFILFDINSFGRSPANGTLPRHQHNGRLFLASGFGIWRDVKRKEQIGIFPKLNHKWVKPLLPSSPWMRTGSVRQRSSWRTCSNIECAAPCCNFQRCQKTARARFVFSKSLWGKTTGSLPDSCKARTKSLGKMIG